MSNRQKNRKTVSLWQHRRNVWIGRCMGVNSLCLWNAPACVLINLFGKNGSFPQIHSGRVTSIVWFTVWQLCQIGRFNAFLSWHRCSKEWVNLKLIEFQALQAFPISNVMHLTYKSRQIGFSVQRQAEFIFPISPGHITSWRICFQTYFSDQKYL